MISARLEPLLTKAASEANSPLAELLRATEIDDDLLEEILEHMEEEPQETVEVEESAASELDPEAVRREIDEVRQFVAQARSTHIDEKTRALLSAIDMRAALIEHFRDRARVMIATEAGAEGVGFDRALRLVTEHILAVRAHFDEAEYWFDLLDSPFLDAPPGRYFLVSQSRDGVGRQSLYRLTHPLAEWVIREAKGLDSPSARLRFDLSDHETKISLLKPLVGKGGALAVEQVVIDAGELKPPGENRAASRGFCVAPALHKSSCIA